MIFSLIITTFNSEKYVESAIKSILNQTRIPDEIIICDDNSTDNTIKICKKYENFLTIHINKNGPSGFTNAFNYALKLGSGDYISILHFDDILHPTFFYLAENALKKNIESKFLICKNYYFKDTDVFNLDFTDSEKNTSIQLLNGREYALKYLEGVFINDHINRCPGSVFHKSLIDLIHFRNEAGLICDDDLFYRIGAFTDVIQIKTPLAGVRINIESESGKLNNLSLNAELSKCYFFLITDWNSKNLLGKSGLDRFIKMFIKLNFHTVYYSIQYNKVEEKEKAVSHHELIKKLYPEIFNRHFKFLYKIFYFLITINMDKLLKKIIVLNENKRKI